MLAFFAFVYVFGTLATKEVLKYTKHDPSIIVIDEVAGQLIPLLFLSYFGVDAFNPQIWWLQFALPAFVLFRIFDILKPFPASYFDKKVANAHGVMLDDVVAGIYATIVLILILSGVSFFSS